MLAPNMDRSGPNEPPRSSRAIADSWRGLYGSDLFSSILLRRGLAVLRNGAIDVNMAGFMVFRDQWSAGIESSSARTEIRLNAVVADISDP
jgi:hypothetical protein